MIDLIKVKNATNANIVIVADTNGNIIDASPSDHATNLALMTQAAFAMCTDLLKDLSDSNLEQLIARSSSHCFIANKINTDHLILIACETTSSFGWLIKYMNSLNTK